METGSSKAYRNLNDGSKGRIYDFRLGPSQDLGQSREGEGRDVKPKNEQTHRFPRQLLENAF